MNTTQTAETIVAAARRRRTGEGGAAAPLAQTADSRRGDTTMTKRTVPINSGAPLRERLAGHPSFRAGGTSLPRTQRREAPLLEAPRGGRLAHSVPGLTPIAPDAPAGPALLAGPTELARWIRAIVGAPASLRLRYRVEEGGWSVVRGGAFVGRNVPTIRAAIEGCVAVDGRVYLLDRSDVTDKTSLADIAAAEQAIRAIMGTLPRLARSEQPRRAAIGARRPALPGREVR